MVEGCCGQMPPRRRVRSNREPLPSNPAPPGGVAMIYLGSGRRDVEGPRSGLRYFVSDHRRHFKVEPSDVDLLLRRREFMLKV